MNIEIGKHLGIGMSRIHIIRLGRGSAIYELMKSSLAAFLLCLVLIRHTLAEWAYLAYGWLGADEPSMWVFVSLTFLLMCAFCYFLLGAVIGIIKTV